MGILARMLGSLEEHTPPAVGAVGLLMDQNGWYYEESQDTSHSRFTIRIEQDRPGDWYVHDSFCEVLGLNDSTREEDVERFFAGAYRWLHLERRPDGPWGDATISVTGSFEDTKGQEHRVHLGFFNRELSDDLRSEDVHRLWARLRLISFPGRGRRRRRNLRFDLMVKLDQDIFG